MNTDYFHHASFESSEDPWSGWEKDANGQTLYITQEETNHVLTVADTAAPHGGVLAKELQGLEPDREYCVSLRARQKRAGETLPKLSWTIGANNVPGDLPVTTTDWETLHWHFRATQATQTLKLTVRETVNDPSYSRGNLDLDDIRIDRVPRSGVTEPTEGALWAKESGHRGSWLTLSLRRPNTHQENHDDQAHYRTDRVG